MPYIEVDRKFQIDIGVAPDTAGELNYRLTSEVLAYVQRKQKNYALLNEVLGVFEAAKQEFYRRVVAPYEDAKILENGDVYE